MHDTANISQQYLLITEKMCAAIARGFKAAAPSVATRTVLRAPRVFTARRSISVSAMSKDGVKLDKNTPDDVWKQMLTAEEVCGG